MQKNQFVILGAQASGKGTQAGLLGKKLKIPVISMGDLLRAESECQTRRGRIIKSIMRAGKFVPVEITNEIIKEGLSEPKTKRGFIIDGYPRQIAQAKFLGQLVPDVRAILIKISDKEAKKRIAGRRICEKCEENYNLISKPPKKRGTCDLCGGRLIQRHDDRPKIVARRLKLFHKETEPVLNYFRRQNKLIEIDGEKSIADVARELLRKV